MSRPITVLLVDDEPDLVEVAAEFLEWEDDRIETLTATDARDGLDRLAAADVDCVVSDYDMPGMTGLEFLRTVREDRPDLPFVLFTGKGSEGVASRAFSAGATDYIQKGSGTDQYAILANRATKYVERTRARVQRDRRLKAIETAREGISILDADGFFTYVNEAYADLYGYAPGEMVGEHWELIYPDEEADLVREEILPVVETTGEWEGETVGLRADGSTFVEDHTVSRTDYGDLVCTVVDATERETWREERDRYRTLVETLDDPVYVLDADGRFSSVNDAFVDLVGHDRETLVGAPADLVTADEAVAAPRRHPGRLGAADAPDGATAEVEVRTRDGERVTCEVHMGALSAEDEGFRGAVGILRDVSEHKEREAELERYRHIVDQMDQAACIYDEEGRFITVNAYLAEWYGTTPSALEGRRSALVEQVRDAAVGDPFAALVAGERERISGELDGEFPGHGHATIAYRLTRLTVDGEFRGVVSVARDVTERRRREDAIEDLHRATRELFRADSKRAVAEQVGHAVRETLGYPNNVVRLLGDDGTSLQPVAVTEGAESVLGDRPVYAVGEGTAGRAFETGETLLYDDVQTVDDDYDRHVARAGMYLPIGEYGTLSINDDTSGAFDETDVQLAETVAANAEVALDRIDRVHELQRQNERLEEFTSVVSHDLRNPLNVAAGRLELARMECDSPHLDDVASAHDRMETMIDDLLTLAREGREVCAPESVDLGALATDCWANVMTEGATLRTRTDRTVRGDPGRIRQLFENLFRNSVEHGSTESRAKPGDSVEHGSTGSRAKPDDGVRGDDGVTVAVGDLDDGFYVEDDGPGIPEADRERVFESGYATAGSGTGFGLAIVKQIVDAHGWTIRVTEGSAGGARFEITGLDAAS